MGQAHVQVCGDPTVDWMITIQSENMPENNPYFWSPPPSLQEVRLSSQAGGSMLVAQLLREIVPADLARIDCVELSQDLLDRPKTSAITCNWTMWQAYAMEGHKPVYRLSQWCQCEPGTWDYAGHRLAAVPDLLLIDDSGLGFRDYETAWPEALAAVRSGRRPDQIILKLAQYGDGRPNPLLRRIIDLGLASRTTILTAIGDLRTCPVKVGVSLSWERIMEDVISAVRSPKCPFSDDRGPGIAFQQVIVTIGASGAIVAGHGTNTLIFDRTGQEGDFAQSLGGQMMGGNTCVAAALAAAWIADRGEVDWTRATLDGIGLARLLHLEGYTVVGNRLQFPCRTLAEEYNGRQAARRQGLFLAGQKNPSRIWDLGMFADRHGWSSDPERRGKWTILAESVLATASHGPIMPQAVARDAVAECARRIVIQGPRAALPDVPIETVGAWRSADRLEIEGVRSVNNAMRDYLSRKPTDSPLSVAVFGPPGSGKSFAIREIARGLGIDKDAQLTFNLTQFESPDQLPLAFHQVRDLHLRGKTPLVFWDEFDTPCQGRPLGWLRYFLAPMQDGTFTDQGIVHPVGGGIYVFAGATRQSFNEFCAGATREEIEAKKPDFVGRLRAYIDVRGPNGDPNTIEDEPYVIRRAFLLNGFLERYARQLKWGADLQIDPGVLNAFLYATAYRHGARSLETLVRMSTLTGKRKFELSSLPPEHLLRMHVNVDEFHALTRLGQRGALRLGITGHMGLDPARMQELEQGMRTVVALIAEHFPERYLTVLSPLATGSDRLFARAVLQGGSARLVAVLPMTQEEYVRDFGASDDHRDDYAGAERRQEFRYWLSQHVNENVKMAPAPTRDEAYQMAGFFIAQHCDAMIAIWDGQQAQGRGGTAEIVARAIELHKPICHIWAGNYRSEEDRRTDVGSKHGHVRYRDFPGQPAGVWVDL